MKKYNFILILLFVVSTMFSQQTPVFSEYHYNPFLINSAYAGLTSKEISLQHNSSFNGVDGAPNTSSITYISDIPYQSIGYGFGVVNDEIGVSKNTNIYGAFTFKIAFDHINKRMDWEIYDMNVLSFGLTVGVQMYRDNLQRLGITNDPNFVENIDITIPTIGAGIMYNRANFFIGFSAPNLVGTSLTTDNSIKVESQFYGYSGFRFYTNHFQKLLIKPSILVKYQKGTPFQTDFNISGVYNKQFEIGLGYRTTSTINAFLGFLY